MGHAEAKRKRSGSRGACGARRRLAAPAPAQAVPLPPRFEVISAPCPYVDPAGAWPECTYAAEGRVYVDPALGSDFSLWHGLGHVFDAERLSDGDRNWFTRALRIRGNFKTWRDPDSNVTDDDGQPVALASELFADAYASCALGEDPRNTDRWDTAYGYMPTLKQHRAICRAIDRVGAR